MNTDMKRRLFLKASLASGAVGIAVGTGLLTPRAVLAARNTAAFDARSVGGAVKESMGSDAMTDSAEITLDIPDNPENGAVVPVAVATTDWRRVHCATGREKHQATVWCLLSGQTDEVGTLYPDQGGRVG